MGSSLIVDDPELAPVVSATHLTNSKEWKAELAWQHQDVGKSTGMSSMEIRTRVAHMVT